MTNYVAALSNASSPYYGEACRLVRSLRLETTITSGVIRWNSNSRVCPEDCVTLAESIGLAVDVAACTAARDAETSEFLAAYRREMANHVPSAEERYEMRAAFGEGTEVVNVITGRRYRT